ncbi:MAG: YceI family protein [Xanthomonadales bacterium]|nr:YceI family protein [Xanthomonadales bacterium]
MTTAGKRCLLGAWSLLAAAIVIGGHCAARGVERVTLDSRQLSIGFEVQWLGFWRIAGRVADAWGEFAFDPVDPGRSRLKVTARTASIRTGFGAGDQQLKSARFFDTDRFPLLTFESTRIDMTDRASGIVTGNLSMRGVTRPVQLTYRMSIDSAQPPGPAPLPVRLLDASGLVQRSEWGMTSLIPEISDEVRLEIRASLR